MRRWPRTALLLGPLACSAALAACGGAAHHRDAAPALRRADATRLIALARRVAREAGSDRCAAARDAAALSARARALVAAGRVPARLRAPLLSGAAAVAADAPACAPPPAPAPAPVPALRTSRPAEHGHGHGRGEGHGKGHPHGHGHGGDRDG